MNKWWGKIAMKDCNCARSWGSFIERFEALKISNIIHWWAEVKVITSGVGGYTLSHFVQLIAIESREETLGQVCDCDHPPLLWSITLHFAAI